MLNSEDCNQFLSFLLCCAYVTQTATGTLTFRSSLVNCHLLHSWVTNTSPGSWVTWVCTTGSTDTEPTDTMITKLYWHKCLISIPLLLDQQLLLSAQWCDTVCSAEGRLSYPLQAPLCQPRSPDFWFLECEMCRHQLCNIRPVVTLHSPVVWVGREASKADNAASQNEQRRCGTAGGHSESL